MIAHASDGGKAARGWRILVGGARIRSLLTALAGSGTADHQPRKARLMQSGCVDQPCGWEVPENCCPTCLESDEAQAIFEEAWACAVHFGFTATCGNYPGRCDAELIPCPPCGCTTICRCGTYSEIPLHGQFCYPIVPAIDGDPYAVGLPMLEIVTPDETIGPDDGRWMLMADGVTIRWCGPLFSACGGWPAQTCEGAWTIRATIGREPPPLLIKGLAEFACEIAKAKLGKDNCLPDGVRSITRRGLTMDVGQELAETINFDTKGTGIGILDLALREYGDCEESPVAFLDPMARQLSGISMPKSLDYQHNMHHRTGGFDHYRHGWSFEAPWVSTPVGS